MPARCFLALLAILCLSCEANPSRQAEAGTQATVADSSRADSLKTTPMEPDSIPPLPEPFHPKDWMGISDTDTFLYHYDDGSISVKAYPWHEGKGIIVFYDRRGSVTHQVESERGQAQTDHTVRFNADGSVHSVAMKGWSRRTGESWWSHVQYSGENRPGQENVQYGKGNQPQRGSPVKK